MISFRNANAVEKTTTTFTARRWKPWTAGKDCPPAAIHVCDVCGNTTWAKPPTSARSAGHRRASSRKWRDGERVVMYDTLP